MKPIFSFRLSGLPKVTEGNAIVLAATAAVPLALMKVRRLVDELDDVSFMSCDKFGREWGFWQFRVFGMAVSIAMDYFLQTIEKATIKIT